MNIVLGKEEPVKRAEKMIFVGQCAKAFKKGNPWLTGCPPAKDEMFEFLRENL
jgi:hypothetical protein